MTRLKTSACMFLLITTPLLSIAAQKAPSTRSSNEQSPSEKSQLRNAFLLKVTAVLDRVLEAQKTFPDENLRVMIQAQVADMLWDYDEARARTLFEHILQISEKLADQGTPAPPSGVGWWYYPVRNQVIGLIMSRDADWATRLVESRGEIATDLKARSTPRNRERTLLQLRLGTHFAQRDPKRAAIAAKPFADSGDFRSLMLLLSLIRFKDAAAADDLFIRALETARRVQPTFEDLYQFASYVFPSFGEGVLRFSGDRSKRDPFAPSSSSPAVVQQFLDLAYKVVIGRLDAAMQGVDGARMNPRSWTDYAIPKSLSPYIDRFMPDKAPAFEARVQEALRRVPADERQYLALTESGTVEELLSRADAISDAKLKDTLIQRAVSKSSYDGDFEKAFAIIERLSNEGARSGARNSLRKRADQKRSDEAWSALNKGDFDRAEALAAELSDWRSDGLLVRSVIGQVSGKDKLRAVRILAEYELRAASIEEPTERAMRLIQLAGFASSIDLNRGFEEMKRAIGEFNQAGFVAELERYRDGENPGPRVNMGLGGLINNWDLHWMGRTDFDRAIALTSQFQMREAGALMLLNACRGALGTPLARAR